MHLRIACVANNCNPITTLLERRAVGCEVDIDRTVVVGGLVGGVAFGATGIANNSALIALMSSWTVRFPWKRLVWCSWWW